MTMPNENHKFFIITFIISLFGCTNFQPSPPFQPIHIPSPEEKPKQRTLPEKQFKHTENPIKEKKPDFIEYSSYHDLGYKITQLNSFIDFIDNAGKKVKSDKIYLARTDYFPLGEKYTNLAKKDIALETGLIKGLVEHGIEIVEKLDFVHPRDPQEFIDTLPMDGFYLHGISLKDLEYIKKNLGTHLLMKYQIIDVDHNNKSAVIYFRLVDIKEMKILSSSVLIEEVGEKQMTFRSGKGLVGDFYEIYNKIKRIESFPKEIVEKKAKIGILNIDNINVDGVYKNPPSKKAIAIENAIVTGLLNNNSIESPFILEKTKGFKLKFPSVYKEIVFNTNPILYEDWHEFNEKTGCDLLFTYRYITNQGLYIKIVDANSNGKILFSHMVPLGTIENRFNKKGMVHNHNTVSSLFKEIIDYGKIENKKLMLINANNQPVESDQYFQSRPTFNELNLAIEEGIISALLNGEITVIEKLKTLYLKKPWMYEAKIFNLNPLYLNNWDQLMNFGVDAIIVYNSLVPYENLDSLSPHYKKILVEFRVVDLATGKIIQIDEISNLE